MMKMVTEVLERKICLGDGTVVSFVSGKGTNFGGISISPPSVVGAGVALTVHPPIYVMPKTVDVLPIKSHDEARAIQMLLQEAIGGVSV